MIAAELQSHSIMELLIMGHHRRRDPEQQAPPRLNELFEDKKAGECLDVLNRLKSGLEDKLCNTDANSQYGHLLTTAKFNFFLMELTTITRLEPMVENNEKLIKTLIKLRNQYEERDSLACLQHPCA